MGANRRNHLGIQSRRFSLCRCLMHDEKYIQLINNYLESKKHCQKGKVENDKHEENIARLSSYLILLQKDFNHS